MTDQNTSTTSETTAETTATEAATGLDAKTALTSDASTSEAKTEGTTETKVEGDGKTETTEAKTEGEGETKVEPVKYDIKPPEGFKALDDKALEAATPLLNKLGVKAEDAQGVIDEFAKEVLPKMAERAQAVAQEAQLEQILTIRKEWDDARVADKEVGGADAGAKLAVAAKALATFGTPELKKLLDDTGIGNHPEIVRAFYRAGQAIAEGQIHRSDGSEQVVKDDGELFYGDKYKRKEAA